MRSPPGHAGGGWFAAIAFAEDDHGDGEDEVLMMTMATVMMRMMVRMTIMRWCDVVVAMLMRPLQIRSPPPAFLPDRCDEAVNQLPRDTHHQVFSLTTFGGVAAYLRLVSNFSGVVAVAVTTTRKIVTIVLSFLLFPDKVRRCPLLW